MNDVKRVIKDADALSRQHQCPGVQHAGCNYLAACGSVCNKCGQIVKPSISLSRQPSESEIQAAEQVLANRTMEQTYAADCARFVLRLAGKGKK
jgi:hypothetical protein